jgi:hypothetical protein
MMAYGQDFIKMASGKMVTIRSMTIRDPQDAT